MLTYDLTFADNILWGSPKGQVLQGFERLNAIHRTQMTGGQTEMAMYVLVERDGRWWVAAGQNTPVTDVLPALNP